jgi:hypothetical protein
MGSHFWPFTHVLRENWPVVTQKNAGIDLTDGLALAALPVSAAMIASAEYSVCNYLRLIWRSIELPQRRFPHLLLSQQKL